MKVLFLLGSPDIGGGTYVIFQHALKCLDNGCDVTVVTYEDVSKERVSWHKGAERLSFKKYEDIENEEYDVAIATWWKTIYELPKVKAKSYIYFVQSIESKFYTEDEKAVKWLVDATYTLPISVITEATWIKNYLEEKYAMDVVLVRNGIRKDVYETYGESYGREDGKLRVLVEGPVDVFFKNVPKTIELVRKSKADEIWLLTSSSIEEYEGVDRVFSRQPIDEAAKIYRSCDVLVKLSYVEGMFGPPLEMFHCGGTAITYDVSGHDEYMKDNYNSLVVKTDDEDGVVEAINKLHDDRKLLEKMKENALKTANEWPDWDSSSQEFYGAVEKLSKREVDRKKLNVLVNFFFDTYVTLENNSKTCRRKVGDFLRAKMPFVYKVYRKLRYGKRA